MSPTVRSIQTSATSRMLMRHDALPAWLLSTIVHMLVVIGLGLLHISAIPGSNLTLLLAPSQNVAEANVPDISGLADFDVAIAAEPIPVSTVEDVPATISNGEILTSLEADWSDLAGSESGTAALVSGLGDIAGLGTGATSEFGKGHSYASLFGVSGKGKKFVYVFDRSESMNSVFTLYSEGRLVSMVTPLLSAKHELIRSLHSLSNTSEFQIVFYNDSPYIFGESHYGGHLYPATDEHKEQARAFIEQMPGQGFTNHLSALEAGIALDPEVIFLLTDAEAKDDLHPHIVRRMAEYCRRRNIVINVVHFCNVPRPESTLVWLAEHTDGKHQFINLESLAESMIDPATF